MLKPLSAKDRAELRATTVSISKIQSSGACSTCSDIPSQLKQMVLSEEGNAWLVAQLI
ncbi:hypothetical protein GXW82_21085 [Streptacidiphilus sp. 4-A2]|nr:hypothetical protein [Streptacidiphilus sp. 4-A2]